MRDQERNWISQHQRSAFTKTFRNFALACWIRVIVQEILIVNCKSSHIKRLLLLIMLRIYSHQKHFVHICDTNTNPISHIKSQHPKKRKAKVKEPVNLCRCHSSTHTNQKDSLNSSLVQSSFTLIPQHYNLTLFISSWATKSCPGFCHVRIFTYLSVAKRKQAKL